MTARATGTFDVTLTPQPAQEGSTPRRLAIAKRFHGDLDAASAGEMLSAATEIKGSAGYVALERVEGSLRGARGSFVLQHSGTLNRGAPSLAISVVPDSGAGDLAGIAGTMTIDIVEGEHRYDFGYTLPDPR